MTKLIVFATVIVACLVVLVWKLYASLISEPQKAGKVTQAKHEQQVKQWTSKAPENKGNEAERPGVLYVRQGFAFL